tara:strand:+ start:2630 stop:3079 length:450 start_codon:yes stop_codon:yes gene_type:complete
MVTKILMVCLGNICRSPLAEESLRQKVDPKLVYVDSAGTGGYHIGKRPDVRSIAIATEHGLDISGQRCRKLCKEDLADFDLIFAMDKSNYNDIVALTVNMAEKRKVSLLLDEVPLGIKEVPDPYYDGEEGFEKVYQLIDTACRAIADRL